MVILSLNSHMHIMPNCSWETLMDCSDLRAALILLLWTRLAFTHCIFRFTIQRTDKTQGKAVLVSETTNKYALVVDVIDGGPDCLGDIDRVELTSCLIEDKTVISFIFVSVIADHLVEVIQPHGFGRYRVRAINSCEASVIKEATQDATHITVATYQVTFVVNTQ